MFIVDSQVHLWAADTPTRPWPRGTKAHRDVPLGPCEMLAEMDRAGVDRAIIVPPLWEGRRNDLALAAAEQYPSRFAVMGRLDPTSPESRGKLAKWREQPGMLGLRFAFHTPQYWPLLTEGHTEWIWADAEKYGVPVYILVPHSLVSLVDSIAERHPGLKIVLDHLALTIGETDDAAFRLFDCVLKTANRPNVAVKVSALPCYSTDTYPFRSLHAYIRKAYEAFGPKRLFWGADFSRTPIPYRQHVTMFTEEIPWLSDSDKEWLMGRGICTWINWPVSAGVTAFA